MGGNDQIVDKTKLTQRELLIRLSDQMDAVNKKLDKLEPDFYDVRERLGKVESRSVWVSGTISVVGVIVALLFNIKKIME
jgi:hypothetical protein